MIGNELVWRKIKSYGKQIIITTLTKSLGTFSLVSLIFGIIFYFNGTPLYLALIFGGIALANMILDSRLEQLNKLFNPILNVLLLIIIINLGAPLDYHLTLGAKIFNLVYILSRTIGKYLGALFGSTITKSPKTVKKYLGLTLLPLSGVSLVFRRIAVNILTNSAPD